VILDSSKLIKNGTSLALQKSVPGHIMPGVAILCVSSNCDDDGFACSNTMGISNLSLSLSQEYHPDSMGKRETNCRVTFVVEELTTL
jgi:hypothetical protein